MGRQLEPLLENLCGVLAQARCGSRRHSPSGAEAQRQAGHQKRAQTRLVNCLEHGAW